jgi:hypothetical protein
MLRHYSQTGVPVVLSTKPWTPNQVEATVRRGPHKSATEYLDFLRTEMAEMIQASQWLVLSYSKVRGHKGLRASPIGVMPSKGRQPRPIVDYSYFGLNAETLPIAPMDSMQFGKALERFIWSIVHADPRFGPVKMIKVDLADGFYRVWVKATDVVKLGVTFPALNGEEPFIAFPIVLPMGCTNSPPWFSSATETIADLANERIAKWRNPPIHHLEAQASTQPEPTPRVEPTPAALPHSLPIPETRDPNLARDHARILASVNIFVDNILAVAQGTPERLACVRRILFDAIDDVFRPLDGLDPAARQEPISVKKLLLGDACWTTKKNIIGWILGTLSMTISLPSNRAERLKELLDDIPRTQHRLSEEKWYTVLGELRSMALALPGARIQLAARSLSAQEKPSHQVVRRRP